jgi:hypothetical protein
MGHKMLSPNVIGTVYSSSLFTYDKNKNIFIGDISLVPQILRQLFKDAFDAGFVIFSEKTGSYAFFYISRIQKNDDYDVEYWEFLPTECTVQQYPQLKTCVVRVFNT